MSTERYAITGLNEDTNSYETICTSSSPDVAYEIMEALHSHFIHGAFDTDHYTHTREPDTSVDEWKDYVRTLLEVV